MKVLQGNSEQNELIEKTFQVNDVEHIPCFMEREKMNIK